MNKDRMILRTPLPDRLCHWAMVVCFFLVAMSGLSWVFPSLNWLNSVFGTPQLARLLHPSSASWCLWPWSICSCAL
jgi:formate dehydrogenase subunit gamma